MVGPLIGRNDGAGFGAGGGTPLTSFLTAGSGIVLTAVKPEELFTAANPLFTAMKPDDDGGRD